MYVPRHFAVDEHAEFVAMARASGFGYLVVHDADGFSSTPVPFVVDDELSSV